MKSDFYIEFETIDEANDFIAAVNDRINDTWDIPRPHPFRESAIISWNLEYLRNCSDLIEGVRRLSLNHVTRAGYPMGYHKGKFHQASQKLEDAAFILDAIKERKGDPNFPALRTLFYGFNAAIYATLQAMGETFKKMDKESQKWWKLEKKRLKKEPLLQALHIDYNTDKHGAYTGILRPKFKWKGCVKPLPDVISGEGAFSILHAGGPRERRIFHNVQGSKFELRLLTDDYTLNGTDLSTLAVPDILELVLYFYQDLLFEAKIQFDPDQ